jgi:hypothetical protein
MTPPPADPGPALNATPATGKYYGRRRGGDAYRLGEFRAFVGQDDHLRHASRQNQLSRAASLLWNRAADARGGE